MARKINLNSSEIYQKLGTPSISAGSTTTTFYSPINRKRSNSTELAYHVQSPDFSKQLPRNELKQFASEAHERRFVAFQTFPIVSTRVPRVSAPDISRTTGRNFMNIYTDKRDSPEYSPNYKAVWKGSGKKILGFEATLPRKPLHKPPQFNLIAKDVKYSQIDPNVMVPDIDKTTSRPNEEGMPAFMINLHYLDRVSGHVVPNFKSLQMNNYMNTSFMPLTSTFGSLESPQKTRSTMRSRRLKSDY